MRQSIVRSSSLRAVVALLLLAPLLARAGTITEVYPDETDEHRFVRQTRALENDPFASNARAVRAWLTTWASETPDITAHLCNTLGPVFDDMEQGDNGRYVVQLLFGNVAFQITHPDERDDRFAVQTGAVESVLRMYANVRAADPQAAIPHLDRLLAKQAEGSLAAELQPLIAKNCSGSTTPVGSPDADAAQD